MTIVPATTNSAAPTPAPVLKTLIVGCGYLGRVLARELLAAGDLVFGTTRSPEKAESLAALGVQPVVADVLDPASLAALPRVDRVVHCVGFDRASNRSLREVYVDGFRNLLAALLPPGHPDPPAILHVGSTGVFGQTDGSWIDETALAMPESESGRACLEAERLLVAHAAAGLAPRGATILRLAGIYGPGRIPRRAFLLEGTPIPGHPAKWLNMVHVHDAATAVRAALDNPPARGLELYLVADDEPLPRVDFYKAAAAALDAPEPAFAPPPPDAPPEPDKRVSNRKARRNLRWTPRHPSAREGLPAAVAEERLSV